MQVQPVGRCQDMPRIQPLKVVLKLVRLCETNLTPLIDDQAELCHLINGDMGHYCEAVDEERVRFTLGGLSVEFSGEVLLSLRENNCHAGELSVCSDLITYWNSRFVATFSTLHFYCT